MQGWTEVVAVEMQNNAYFMEPVLSLSAFFLTVAVPETKNKPSEK